MSSTSEQAVSISLNGVPVVDTFAEAFNAYGTRLVITAINERWVEEAAKVFCGYATSVIACDLEAGIAQRLSTRETPDGRPGIAILAFAFQREKLEEAVGNRVGQCILTCPTTACYDGLPEGLPEKRIPLGDRLRYFGDGHQLSKKIGERRYWRIPVMDGEFLCEDSLGTQKGVAGGNLLICGESQQAALLATEKAVASTESLPDVILPFPGGIVRSGSKVGSKYPKLIASTNHAFCPTLKAQPDSELPHGVNAVYEIVIDGLSFEAVGEAMKTALHTICGCDGILQVTAGNYGGKLGKHHFKLKDLIEN